ncbi:hypothetical protein MUK42_37135 [Musa troglodytarum]|uniref:Uncharacterized protein n=1 Tax=Musa troglodytarum TaxID=320322 RepID=A0A9E7FFW5_9LILI|nr:hypothetical protein MUK42_37135 [Musa troglodytarum]
MGRNRGFPSMASAVPSSSSSDGGATTGRRPLGLVANAIKRKDGFLHLFIMTGILMLSVRSLGQKYRIRDLSRDNDVLREEHDALCCRTAAVKDALLHEASLDSSGLLADHLRRLFREDTDH